ncbi:MAG: hypothetical protein ACRC1K_10360 [Planctomycetia bacterium]
MLFDQGTPVPLRHHLPNHEVSTAFELGWDKLENGELLRQAENNGFEVLVTTDQNLKYQRNSAGRRIAVVVLCTTSWPRLRTILPDIAAVVDAMTPNGYIEVVVPKNG